MSTQAATAAQLRLLDIRPIQPINGVGKTIDERFEAFHAENPALDGFFATRPRRAKGGEA